MRFPIFFVLAYRENLPHEIHRTPFLCSHVRWLPGSRFVNLEIDNGKGNFQKVRKNFLKSIDRCKKIVYNVLVRLIKQL